MGDKSSKRGTRRVKPTSAPRTIRSKDAPRSSNLKRKPAARAPESKPEQNAPAPDDKSTPREPAHAAMVVGIGASAGGVEALETFFKHVPRDTGSAYVVVQHRAPAQRDMLVPLLQRATDIPVLPARDGTTVQPDHCYVIPASAAAAFQHGRLQLLPKPQSNGPYLPIDHFFRSLAVDQGERSVAVILSGMGSDGTLGVRAIKERAGAAFVQSLASAKFDGMPRSAIEAGLADVVAPVEDLPARIVEYGKRVPTVVRSIDAAEAKRQLELEKVFVLLRAHTGNDFLLYKRSTIQRRIARRMALHQIELMSHYVRYLRENPRELDLLFKDLLIGVTNFFRDPAAWDHFKFDVMPMLLAKRASTGILRAWVPGCSTGEEAYSLAMLFKEAVEPLKPVQNLMLQIFATDLDRDAIEFARQGLYPDNIAADVTPQRLRRFFVHEDRGYRIGKDIREMVVFAPQSIIMDPPFTKLDILSCRNLLIYLSPELQKKLIPLFHYSLNPDGVLFLGSAETVGAFSNLFVPLDSTSRLYRKLDQSLARSELDFPASFVDATPIVASPEPTHASLAPQSPNLERLADRVLVQRFSPLGVLCNERGDVLYISGRAGRYFEPAVGKANLNVFAMAREGLRYELTTAFTAACRERTVVTVQGISVGTNGGTQLIDLAVERLTEPKALRGTVLVVIRDAPQARPRDKKRPVAVSDRTRALEQELQRAREEVQSAREEMQTSQEELRSTNEELQSANEELQSTNEELTTSKEEMQSLNEELQTVNQELQSKVDELSRSNNDMKNLLNSTDIATLFLDADLRVRRFTTPTAKIIKLIAGDAGRAITDIVSELDYPELAEDAREVLRTLAFRERQCGTRDGRWFVVRIMPYRTLENVIDGLVITFTDASPARALEATLREQASDLQEMPESLPILVWSASSDGKWDYVNRRWVEYTGNAYHEALGDGWVEQVHPLERDGVRASWRDAVQDGSSFQAEFRLRSETGSYCWFRACAIRNPGSGHAVGKWYGTATDIDDLKRAAGAPSES